MCEVKVKALAREPRSPLKPTPWESMQRVTEFGRGSMDGGDRTHKQTLLW